MYVSWFFFDSAGNSDCMEERWKNLITYLLAIILLFVFISIFPHNINVIELKTNNKIIQCTTKIIILKNGYSYVH